MRNFNYPKNKDSAMYYQNVTHNVTELIKSITFWVNFPNPSTNRSHIRLNDYDFSHYVRGTYLPTFGQCFSMEVPIWIKHLKVSKQKCSFHNTKTYIANVFSDKNYCICY